MTPRELSRARVEDKWTARETRRLPGLSHAMTALPAPRSCDLCRLSIPLARARRGNPFRSR